ncbi:mitochondrial Rho GTPase 1-like [Senna tora]|uniref:Mitochondrial Rho GTPase 1-like n=1 Tax=Senna tora TaxID=362788 RepID=A0A834WQR4_9FABA|nr:mitochondrial Rho GTPase 1-like [Senna tora]
MEFLDFLLRKQPVQSSLIPPTSLLRNQAASLSRERISFQSERFLYLTAAPMGNANAGAVSLSHGRSGVRIVVAGDRGTGKSSLIRTAVIGTFPENVPPPVLLPTKLRRQDLSEDSDTDGVAEELKRADAVVLTYACDLPETLERLCTFWLPQLRKLEVKVPVIVVGCKQDLKDENQQVSLDQVMSPITRQFPEIETYIECSALRHFQVAEVFYYAQRSVLHPKAPLFDVESQTLKPPCVEALKRIFILCDQDKDGALSDSELNDFQVKCFNAPLLPSQIVDIKKLVQEKLSQGVNEQGLTLEGFLFLHSYFIEKGYLGTIWTVLRKFGYNDEVKLVDDIGLIQPQLIVPWHHIRQLIVPWLHVLICLFYLISYMVMAYLLRSWYI